MNIKFKLINNNENAIIKNNVSYSQFGKDKNSGYLKQI